MSWNFGFKLPTSGVDADPVQVTRQLFGNVRFASGRETHHRDDMGTVDVVGTFT